MPERLTKKSVNFSSFKFITHWREPPTAMSLLDLLCSTEPPLYSISFIIKLQKFYYEKEDIKKFVKIVDLNLTLFWKIIYLYNKAKQSYICCLAGQTAGLIGLKFFDTHGCYRLKKIVFFSFKNYFFIHSIYS